MSELRDLLAEMGLDDPKTLLQSGNFVFGADADPDWEAAIEQALAERLSVKAEVYVRSSAEWERLIRENPFAEMAEKDPSHLLAIIFRKLPARSDVEEAIEGYVGPESLGLRSVALYATFPDGIGASKLSTWPPWKKLNLHGTARNWNTVVKLDKILRG